MSDIIKIKVICDDNREDKRRVCFWASEQILSKFNQKEHSFEFLNIADYLDKKPINSDYLDKHPAFAAFLIDKYNYQIKNKPYVDDLKEKIDDYLKKKPYDSQQKIYEALEHLKTLTNELEHSEISILLDLFGNTLDPLFLLSLFEKENTDIIIVNWGAINNDTVYSSERSFQFFSHYRRALNLWVKDGGIFILEVQSGQWVLSQDSYQIFEKKIVTMKEDIYPHHEAKKNIELKKDHPVLLNVSDKIELTSNVFDDWCFFPKKIKNKECQSCMPRCANEKLYLGWFEKYKNKWDFFHINWEPLILTSDETNKKPIMLWSIRCNDEKKGPAGAYILTTMYLGSSILGSSDIELLIKNIFGLVTNNNALFNYYFEKQTELDHEKIKLCSKVLVILFILAIVYLVLTNPKLYALISILILGLISEVKGQLISASIMKLLDYIFHILQKLWTKLTT